VVYRLKHIAAPEISDAVQQAMLKLGRRIESIAVDPRTNSVLVKAGPDAQEAIKDTIEKLDRAATPGDAAPVAPQGGGQIYISGLVPRPGTYALPDSGPLTLRRLLVASGGITGDAKSVIICETRNGRSLPILSFAAEEFRKPEGADPELKPGQIVSVQ
jgi:protein involved in polysaccharide export with SLBB domain